MQVHPEETPGAALAAGTRLGKYQVVRLIGEGGMGAVYEGVHLAIGKKVAIKIISPHLAENLDARARFLREAQLTSRVRHPHAVDVTDVGSEAGQTFLVMEFLDGEDLASFLEWRGRLPIEQAVDFMLAVAGRRGGRPRRRHRPPRSEAAQHLPVADAGRGDRAEGRSTSASRRGRRTCGRSPRAPRR